MSELLQNTDLARFVVRLLPDSLISHDDDESSTGTHRTLTAFNAACWYEYLVRCKPGAVDEGTAAFLVQAFLDPLRVAAVGVKARANTKTKAKSKGVGKPVSRDVIVRVDVLREESR